ncbi:GAF and ANTAR domain-containing protein [Bailinhaonella thermotolerans]|uniref:ANTAR domain-containing protein n=1 Tax=Bailinhaonella thermotolerans TaxID=1070861 RepID=A0A3A4BT60_9ACTN|nr:GAF and ANTAR domain-containing protein [Bailinhaonella thermotolerans]RJL34496.1 ANTAR domain-containing protein [Bailinhaonella thermotolerans]
MFTERLAHDLAALTRVGTASIETVLHRVTALAVTGIAGCSGGTIQIWDDGRVIRSAASHSGLARLLARERALGEGPSREAVRRARRVTAPDLMRDDRWPAYARSAVRHGVRSALILPMRVGESSAALGVYGARPQEFDERLAEMVAAHMAVALANSLDYDFLRSETLQLREALTSRAEIDQAKGILMGAKGCDADTAFEELRKVSQRHQVRVADVARRLVEDQLKRR